MGSVEVHRAVLRVNQSQVRRDLDPWHDAAILSDDGPRRSSQDEVIAATSMKSVTIAYFREERFRLVASEPVLFGEWYFKNFQSSIGCAWKTVLAADDRGYFVTITHTSHVLAVSVQTRNENIENCRFSRTFLKDPWIVLSIACSSFNRGVFAAVQFVLSGSAYEHISRCGCPAANDQECESSDNSLLEFEYCNVYMGIYGKTVPLVHRHPDAVVWNKGDHDHVFFLTMSQLFPCRKDKKADSWSMIVFWNESKGYYDDPHAVDDEVCQHLKSNSGAQVPVPGRESDLKRPYDPSDGGGPPPGGGPQGLGLGPSPDEQPLPMEYTDEPPPDGGLKSANAVACASHSYHSSSDSAAKSRMVHPSGPPLVLLPGQSAGKQYPDPPGRISQQTPIPEFTPEPPVQDAAGESDSDATVDYRDDSLLAVGDEDVLIRLPIFSVPSFVPLDGDGFASLLTKQDKIKAGTFTLEMQRKYAKEIRAAKLEELKSYLDNDASLDVTSVF
ncbi:GIP [Symbiodinium sp. CCMP2456]|nr:GIP [Symbiodinium sp. CCMP2456]